MHFFAGKGGVGKTTCAAAAAVAAARRGERALVISTDPAHSLGDALNRRVGPRISARRVGRGVLATLELDADAAYRRWISRNRRPLADIFQRGSWLDRADLDALLDLRIPGVDELMAFLEIHRLVGARLKPRAPSSSRSSPGARGFSRAYDLIVVDTAPTGHTLRLMAAPDTAAAFAELLDTLQESHRTLQRHFGRVTPPGAPERLVAQIAAEARETGALLRDRERARFTLVTLPEELSIAEAQDALDAFNKNGISVADVIVNRVTPSGPACPTCTPRRAAERGMLARIRTSLGNARPVRIIPALSAEPRGPTQLVRIGQPPIQRRRRSARRVRRSRGRLSPPETIESIRDAQLVIFAGKGGVGKTTCAAATALRLAAADPRRRILLMSTDPAHSLGDVFATAIGDAPVAIQGAPIRLHAREVDAPRALVSRRLQIEAAIEEIGATAGVGAVGASAAEILDLAPPGIDELLGMLSIIDPLEGSADSQYDLVILDTAPTGHALRLLELPDAAHEWVQMLMRLLLKYRNLVRPGRLAADLVALSQSIRRLKAVLRNHGRTQCVVVTRAASLPRVETDRLLVRLRRIGLATAGVVVNAVTPSGGVCPWCRHIESAERAELRQIVRSARRGARRRSVLLTPLVAPPPRGSAALEAWAGSWRSV